MADGKRLKCQLVSIGKRLYNCRLVAARGGNLSAWLEENSILITKHGACLGELKASDVLQVNLDPDPAGTMDGLSTEFPLHRLIYLAFPVNAVLHCHSPLTTAYFSVNERMEHVTFEHRLFLGNVPVLTQDTPHVSRPDVVVEALRNSNVVVIKNHGVLAMADTLSEALFLVEDLEEASKMAGYVEKAEVEGAEVLCGGGPPEDPSVADGFFFRPTILGGVRPDMTVFQEEIFSPVASITEFHDDNEAVELANNSRFGLAACIWSQDRKKAKELSRKINAGIIWVNTYGMYYNDAPYGGFKQSSCGKELGKDGFWEYTRLKHVNCHILLEKPLVSYWHPL